MSTYPPLPSVLDPGFRWSGFSGVRSHTDVHRFESLGVEPQHVFISGMPGLISKSRSLGKGICSVQAEGCTCSGSTRNAGALLEWIAKLDDQLTFSCCDMIQLDQISHFPPRGVPGFPFELLNVL